MKGIYRTSNADSQTDTLYIAGDVLGSPTSVTFQSMDNIGAQTVGDGIKVIEVAGDSNPTNFQQNSLLYAGLYIYTLRAGKADGTFDGAWYLSSDINPDPPPEPPPPIVPPPEPPTEPPTEPPEPGPEEPDPGPEPNLIPPPPPIPNYRPEVVTPNIIPALAYGSGMAFIATYQERIAGTDDKILGSGQWFRHFHYKSDIAYQNDGRIADKVRVFEENGANYNNTLHGFQFGMDLFRSDSATETPPPAHAPLKAMHKAGIFAGIIRSRAEVDSITTHTSAGSVRLTNIGVGAYYTEHFDRGFYTDNNVSVHLLHDISSSDYATDTPKSSTDGHAFLLSTEFGYRHQLSEDVFIEPQVQLVYQHMKIKDLALAPDIHAAFDNTSALTSRIGLRLGTSFGETKSNTAYIRAALEQSHHSKADIHYHNPKMGQSTERVLHNEMHGSWFKLDAGINGALSNNTVGYVAIDYAKGLRDADSQKFGLKVGFQYHF